MRYSQEPFHGSAPVAVEDGGWIEPGIWIGSSAQLCRSTRCGAAIGTGVLDSTRSSLCWQRHGGATEYASYPFRQIECATLTTKHAIMYTF